MRYLIVGTGAVGGYLGSLLMSSGSDVTFLVRPHRAAELHRNGLRLRRPNGEVSVIDIAALTADALEPDFDVVLLSVKAFALESAIDDMRGAIGLNTLVIPSLNGIGHLSVLETAFPGQVLGGVVFVVTELSPDGTIVVHQPEATLTFGELDGSDSDRVRRITADLSRSPFAASASPTITADMWEKWLMLAAGGAINTLIGGPIGPAVDVDGGELTADRVIDEVVSAMTAAGHPPRTLRLAPIRQRLTEHGSTFTTSMFRDHIAGRPVEVEAILGDLVRLAVEHRVAVPLLTAAAARLRLASD